MDAVTDIPVWRLGLAYCLFILVYGLSAVKKLNLGRDLFTSVMRMTLQLTLMGGILVYLFQIRLWFVMPLIYSAMLLFATQAIVKRSGIRFPGIYPMIYGSLICGAGLVFTLFILAVVHNRPWYDPRYFIPLGGMILGNSMNGSALAIERFFDDVRTRRREIETMISFGATSGEAAQSGFRKAFRAALTPTLMSMTGMGLVFLPGMMTGQILGGSPPLVAIKYQIAIMAAILSSVSLTCFFMLHFESKKLFDEYHLLRDDILETH